MRRLWSHIALAATSLLMVGATFSAVVTSNKFNSNIEFENGKEMVFRINNKDAADGKPDFDSEITDDDAVKEIAKIMESRLETSNVTRYKVETQGKDTLKVSFVQDTERQYEIIKSYLTFDATLALSNSKETVAYAEEFLNTSKKAYLETTNGYPTVVIPIDKDSQAFKAVYEEAKEMSDNGEGEVEIESDDENAEEGEHEHEHRAYLYLWYNYVKDYYSYSKIDQNNTDEYDANIASKILMTFDAADPFYDEDHTALRAYINPNSDNSSAVTADALKTAYENGRFYVNLLNADKLDYYVTFLFSAKADVWVESLLNLGEKETLAWSRTFIATVCAIVVCSLLLVYFYRLGALSVATTSIVSTFFGLLFIVLLGAEFNIAGIVGLISLGFASIVSGVIYLNKFKDECYRGRSLKKANSEAAKKALLPTIDVHVALVVIGVMCYLLGSAIMKSFAVATVLGGLVSLVLNIGGLRGLMWLVTNEQGLANRYDLFDVDKEQVPNALEEEKQKFYGANADKDFTKHKKPIALVAAVLFVASLTGMIVFGAINSAEVYGTTSKVANSQLYVEYSSVLENDTSLSIETKEKLDDLLANTTIKLDGKTDTELKKAIDFENIETYDYTARSENTNSGLVTTYYAYYRISFKSALKGDELVTYKTLDPQAASVFFNSADNESQALNDLHFNSKVKFELKGTERVSADQPEFKSIILATAIAGASIAVYLLLRYRLSRGLASLGIAVLSVGISAGIFALLHFLPATSYASVALPFIALFSFAIGILYMNKEREMVLEDRNRDNSVENRNAMMIRAIGISSTPITIAFIFALYLGVNFFGFMSTGVSYVFLLIILGVSIATVITLTLMGPCAQILFKWFSKINLPKPERKKKKVRQVRVKKSAEPEEAIFIGIND